MFKKKHKKKTEYFFIKKTNKTKQVFLERPFGASCQKLSAASYAGSQVEKRQGGKIKTHETREGRKLLRLLLPDRLEKQRYRYRERTEGQKREKF